jgi:methylase of polypeptide subunit release factors
MPESKEKKHRAWPAEKVQLWSLARIKPYPNNPRSHSEEQIRQIANSMQRFGVTSPVLVDEKGVLIYGHGRLRAAQFLDLARLPVVVARGWSEEDKRAYRIADNQIALNAEWDVPLLAVELRELSLSGYDMPLLGFGDMELVEFMAYRDGEVEDQDKAVPDRELSDDEKPLMIKAWQRLAGEWLAILEKQELLSTNFTRGALAALFLRARFFGAAIPGQATLAYTPHRALTAAGRTISVPEALRKALSNEQNIIERLWFVMGGKPRLDGLLTSTLPFLDARIPGEFPVDLARSLIDEFVPPGGRVLDPCHGWGGRMLGFLLSKAAHYHGFDTDPLTVKGVQAMFDDLRGYADGARIALLECKPFEESVLGAKTFDFALTSPPYFDTEKYGGKESSWRRYQTFDAWVEGFYRPLLTKTARALKPGGVFALQIGNQRHPLERVARELAEDCGFGVVATRFTEMADHGYVGLGTEGAVERDPAEHEVVVLLRAGGTGDAPEQHAAAEPVSAR